MKPATPVLRKPAPRVGKQEDGTYATWPPITVLPTPLPCAADCIEASSVVEGGYLLFVALVPYGPEHALADYRPLQVLQRVDKRSGHHDALTHVCREVYLHLPMGETRRNRDSPCLGDLFPVRELREQQIHQGR